ncbi:MAG: YggS family pyridoxal phosphate-dependent enzyme, partial [Bacteroidota bacterium]|nr:YggS family pyridoxal phosphate-dependent enzyme [Bacteroidota bacterium]
APFINLIHSVDSIRLLQEIDKRAKQNNRIIDCLLQVHLAQEKTKSGFKIEEVENIIKISTEFKNIAITGLMAMATFTNDSNQIDKEFESISQLFKKIRTKELNTLSIGMSGDYKLAINNDSTMIRVGSTIFGNRN